jgi:rhodanese-like protein
MRKRLTILMLSLLVASGFIVSSPAMASAKKPRMLKPCSQCHEVESNQIRGRLINKSKKAKTMQIFVGKGTWTVNFNDDTELDGAKSITKIKKKKEVLVDFVKQGQTYVATSVVVKQPASIPPKWILNAKGMKKLLKKSPAAGNYSLYDARPGKLFPAAHLKGAISNYDGKFAKNVGKLPKDKNKLVVFYCGGPT